jgi:hypothetical protein
MADEKLRDIYEIFINATEAVDFAMSLIQENCKHLKTIQLYCLAPPSIPQMKTSLVENLLIDTKNLIRINI